VPGYSEQNDVELLAHIRQGSHEAFSVLVRRHVQKTYAVAYRFIGDRDEAEDIVQSAFLKLWERPGMWKSSAKSRFTTWFYRVVVNLCLDWQKKKKPLLFAHSFQQQSSDEVGEERLMQMEKQMKLEKQISVLPERQRAAINLCFYSGLSNREAAEVLGVSVRALQSLVMRAKSNIKNSLLELP